MEKPQVGTEKDGANKNLSKKEKSSSKILKTTAKPDSADGSKLSQQQPEKSKAALRAERRAKQEAERAAKALKKAEQGLSNKGKGPRISANIQADDVKLQKKTVKALERQQVPRRVEGQKKVAFFSHLHQYERSFSITKEVGFGTTTIHPAIIQLGLQYAEGAISGSNARCVALMDAFCQLIADYTTPPDKELSRHLESKLKPAISFLNQCRPLSVSMGSAIKYIKMKLSKIPSGTPDSEAKQNLLNDLKNFVHENIELAQIAISNFALTKISDGDVVMVYGSSSLINYILTQAHKEKKFRVIVVDGRPKLSGLNAVRKLTAVGIECSYVLVSAAAYVVPEVTKVLLGAHALLSNGYVMGSVGTSLVAMVAKNRGVPVIVCCEAYKFCERAQTDSFVNNEIGDPRDLLVTPNHNISPLLRDDTYKELESLKMLNLTYDVTPPDYIAMVVTELGTLPCTSVPVVLRVRSVDAGS